MHKKKENRKSDQLVIFTILTTLAAMVFGFFTEHSKVTESNSSFAEEVASPKDTTNTTNKQNDTEEKADKAAEVTQTSETAPTEEASPTDVAASEQVAEPVLASETPQIAAASAEAGAPAPVQTSAAYAGGGYALANGNTAGAIGSEAAAQMAAATGVSQETWEYIIARESNGNPYVANASGASGLFQTMPGWGSTATVQDQVNSAINAYNAQGLSAWGM